MIEIVAKDLLPPTFTVNFDASALIYGSLIIDKDCQSREIETVPTQNVNLTPQLERFVLEAVKSGEFNNASEVHRAALTALAREREERALRLERLRREVEVGFRSGSPKKISDISRFLEKCSEEVLHERMSAVKRATAHR